MNGSTPSTDNHHMIVTVPGLGGSDERHWQTLWERGHADTVRAELGGWATPDRAWWVERLDAAIAAADAPVILAAHSLGCMTVAWWACARRDAGGVAGALLVAPADVDRVDAPELLRGFAPAPLAPLPFPSIVVASSDDPWVAPDCARRLARAWGSRFTEVGALGHINAESGLGIWPSGRALVERLAADAERRPVALPDARRRAGPTASWGGYA